MTDSEKKTFDKIEEIYNSEKGKNFITHLIRSFFPVDKAQYVWDKKEKPMKCCITGTNLVSKADLMQAMQDTSPKEFGDFMKSSLGLTEGEKPKEHPVKKRIGDSLLGIETKESNKFLCKEAHEQLYNFYATKLLNGDGHMNWVGKRMMADRGIQNVKANGIKITPIEEKAVKKNVDKPKKMTFGDLDALKSLKEKLKKK